jgi:hypothetical protein
MDRLVVLDHGALWSRARTAAAARQWPLRRALASASGGIDAGMQAAE